MSLCINIPAQLNMDGSVGVKMGWFGNGLKRVRIKTGHLFVMGETSQVMLTQNTFYPKIELLRSD